MLAEVTFSSDVSYLTVDTVAPGRLWGDLGQIECLYDISNSTLWSYMDFDGRPSYNPALLEDFHGWQRHIPELNDEVGDGLKYVVLGSRRKGAFCFGGDLDYFTDCIARQDAEALGSYGRSCISILHKNWRACDRQLISIGLVQGDALGGGFESLLSFDVIIAEKGTKFGFPEQLFGLFPGMGALSFLGRKIGFAKAEQMVRTGRLATAEELYELGVVHVLAEPGEGVSAVNRYIQKNGPKHAAHFRMHQASKRANPINYQELDDIVGLWVDACMTLEDHNLAVMRRLVSAQTKLSAAA